MTTSAIRPAWTPLNIGLMILGFIVFWPLGLAMLAYIIWGDRFHDMFDNAKEKAKTTKSQFASKGPFTPTMKTGNAAFDAYRDRELERLNEERKKLDEERAEFEAYVQQLRQAKDQEEFDHFMKSRQTPTSKPTGNDMSAGDDQVSDNNGTAPQPTA